MANPGFEFPKELPKEFRDFADKSVDQARNAFGNFLASAAKTSEQLQSTGTNVQSTLHAAVLKGLDHAQTNANATFDFAQKISKSKDLKEAFELQSEFVKSQFAVLQAQVKDYGSLAEKVKH